MITAPYTQKGRWPILINAFFIESKAVYQYRNVSSFKVHKLVSSLGNFCCTGYRLSLVPLTYVVSATA